MYFDLKKFANVSRESVLTPLMKNIWDNMGIGVAVVNAQGICEYMNATQSRTDGFENIDVVGQHITSLYVPHELECIPTIECLQKGQPLLKKKYIYKTANNLTGHTVTDFFPLTNRGRKDGVIAFTVLTDQQGEKRKTSQQKKPLVPRPATTDFYTFASIVGKDSALLDIIREAKTAAKTSSPVMIWGESGTGKELFAQAIHAESDRREHPFVAVNCAAIPENLLESLLFGTTKGSFTDAADKPGLLEEAHGGTLLLDELNSMPLSLQAKLLRVLQEKHVRRLGSHTEIPVNVRIISILNEAPLVAVRNGLLRHDLFYRLAVVGVEVPALRKRKDDIPLLANTFIQRSEHAQHAAPIEISDEVLHMFYEYNWSGNIRELLHVIEGSLVLLGTGHCIHKDCLPRHFREACETSGASEGNTTSTHQAQAVSDSPTTMYYDYRNVTKSSVIPLKTCVQEYESQCIRNVLRVTGGNVAKAARIFEITAAGLRYKMKQMGICEEE
ncbi:MAG: sigma 54-interacting transcriptional regulator [Desulfovibrionales bacterium]|nr:sigma 54-interacting transcriptional regulator [Desulfovibrionales bacterium]